eukprot:GHVT01082585.1.p1 GENE.GHVT01082585.1~~GHVT01082585.1.p1  ORF type:complete len:606 (+),score=44.31 GHVT01082585.1:498-2315(+)
MNHFQKYDRRASAQLSLDILDELLLWGVIEFTPAPAVSLTRLAVVCKRLRDASQNEWIWRKLFLDRYRAQLTRKVCKVYSVPNSIRLRRFRKGENESDESLEPSISNAENEGLGCETSRLSGTKSTEAKAIASWRTSYVTKLLADRSFVKGSFARTRIVRPHSLESVSQDHVFALRLLDEGHLAAFLLSAGQIGLLDCETGNICRWWACTSPARCFTFCDQENSDRLAYFRRNVSRSCSPDSCSDGGSSNQLRGTTCKSQSQGFPSCSSLVSRRLLTSVISPPSRGAVFNREPSATYRKPTGDVLPSGGARIQCPLESTLGTKRSHQESFIRDDDDNDDDDDKTIFGGGVHLWAGHNDGTLRGWNFVDSADPVVSMRPHYSAVTSIASAASSEIIYTGSDTGDVAAWDAVKRKPTWVSNGEHSDTVSAIALSHSGLVVTASRDRRVLGFDAREGRRPVIRFPDHDQWVMGLLPGPRPGASEFNLLTADKALHLWDLRAVEQSIPIFRAHRHRRLITSVRGRGPHVVTSSMDGTVMVAEVACADTQMSYLENRSDDVSVTPPGCYFASANNVAVKRPEWITAMDCDESVLAIGRLGGIIEVMKLLP